MNLIYLGIALILAGGLTAIFVPNRARATLFCVFSVLAAVPLAFASLSVLLEGRVVSETLTLSWSLGTVPIRMDALSAIFVLLFSVVGALIAVFSVGYLRHHVAEGRSLASHFLFLAILMSSMILLTLIQSALAFLVVWEIMSISSFLLVILENESREVMRAGIEYLIAMHVGVLFLIAGFAYLSLRSGSLDFDSFSALLSREPFVKDIVFLLMVVGFGTKAGFVPFHTWLPKAHPAAPGHISALMSGLMIKTGIYGILRVLSLSGRPSVEMSLFLMLIAVATTLSGISYAVAEKDLKKALAYSSIENIGIMGIAVSVACLGAATGNSFVAGLGIVGAVFHLINHSVFKSLLFASAAKVAQVFGTRNMEALGGVARVLPASAVFFLLGSVALCALPPMAGLAGEFVIYFAMIQGFASNSVLLYVAAIACMAVLALAGALAVLAMSRAYGIVFSGSRRSVSPVHAATEGPSLIIPFTALAALSFACAVFAPLVVRVLGGVAATVFPFASIAAPGFSDALSKLSFFALLVPALFAIPLILRSFLLRKSRKNLSRYKTWDCGYQAGSARIQYTASSYSENAVRLLRPLLRVSNTETTVKGEFPKEAAFLSVSVDRTEAYVIRPALKALRWILDRVSVVQSRNIRQYLLYVFFLLALVIGLVMVLG